MLQDLSMKAIVMQVELVIEEIHVMSRAEVPPFDVESASRSAKELEEVRFSQKPSRTNESNSPHA